ncbi:MAG: ApaLI family restriction endonuclease [Kiritimatiellae bacterium]|nr:ApaLI family restriction endonuclease [Kiritimatiellia bacterium]
MVTSRNTIKVPTDGQANTKTKVYISIYESIRNLADKYEKELHSKIEERGEEMKTDDRSHFLIYRVLGISQREGELVDFYQNKGRFLYKYAGSFLEEATIECLRRKFPKGRKAHVPNSFGTRPKQYEIDFLNGVDALEIKWRDATTDGDHITKEHARVKSIRKQKLKPIRVMFYYPQREQAKRIQENLKTLYHGVKGEYYSDDEAWAFIRRYTGIDMKSILEQIANERELANA